MGRPKSEKLNMFSVNGLIKSLTDLANDASLFMRERAQMIQLERESLIAREKMINETADLMAKNFAGIQAQKLETTLQEVAKNESGTDPKPANLAAIFGTSTDPVSK